MKVKIKGRVYDSDDEPIMLILDKSDKEKINDMRPIDSLYCAFPDGTPEEVTFKFMGIGTDREKCPHLSSYRVKGVPHCVSCHIELPPARPAEET